MKILFNKYEGTGNDFIIINNFSRQLSPSDNELVRRLCDRRFGIGADGLILIEKCQGYDFRMIYFNADGYEANMCGNGGRCASHFVMKEITGKSSVRFLAADGEHHATSTGGLIDLTINDVKGISETPDGVLLNTGVPHLVVFMNNVADAELVNIARPVRYSPRYAPEGVNVNLAEVDGATLIVRTYERGVEDETLSCGTGVTASAIAAVRTGKVVTDRVRVRVKGGELHVSFNIMDDCVSDIHLTGPASFVFKGEIDIQK